MAEAYEVVFQNVAWNELFELLKFLEKGAQNVSDLDISENLNNRFFFTVDKSLIDEFTAYQGDVCLVEKLYGFAVSKQICLPLALLRVVKYQNKLDVELSFDHTFYSNINCVMSAMQIYASNLSKKFKIKEFYGGMEPAVDIDTRYFTGDIWGPLGLV